MNCNRESLQKVCEHLHLSLVCPFRFIPLSVLGLSLSVYPLKCALGMAEGKKTNNCKRTPENTIMCHFSVQSLHFLRLFLPCVGGLPWLVKEDKWSPKSKCQCTLEPREARDRHSGCTTQTVCSAAADVTPGVPLTFPASHLRLHWRACGPAKKNTPKWPMYQVRKLVTLNLLFLAFWEKGKENHLKNNGFYCCQTPRILGKEGG